MATRRPRVKVAANLSIRRPPKVNTANAAVEPIKQDVPEAPSELVKETDVANSTLPASSNNSVPEEDAQTVTLPSLKLDAQPEEPFQEFKLPKPVDDFVKAHIPSSSGIPEPNVSLPSNVHNGEEPTSPRKQDNRPTFTLPLARKRNRTESLTSNKSLPEGVTVNKVTRKVATKQEESQRTLDNKKEIRKRLTNIENVDKQNLTMFDMIYYNPVNNPMTPPALSKRGSLENIPKSVDTGGRERDGARSRSVSKSRSPTPAPSSGSTSVSTQKPPAQTPVQLTPQLKLGPNGEMILDEASLVIENEREREMRETLANTDIVYQDEFSGNSGYYSRNRRTKEWDNDETIRFYRCLHTIGTDFSMMLALFPQRSRRELKLKFKKEERLNLRLVNKALKNPKEFNVEELRQQFADEDEELERQKQERKVEALKTQQKEQLQKKLFLQMSTSSSPQRKLSKSERAMMDTSELLREELKMSKRRTAPLKKRSTAKPTLTIPTELPSVKEEQQQQSGTFSDTVLSNLESNQVIAPLDNATLKDSFKKPKRVPAPKKRATGKLDSNTITTTIVEQEELHPQSVSVPEKENDCTAVNADSATLNLPIVVGESSQNGKKRDTIKLASANAAANMEQTASVPEDNISPHFLTPDTTIAVLPATMDDNTNRKIIPSISSSLLDSTHADKSEQRQQPTETILEGKGLVVMKERKNTSTPVASAAIKCSKIPSRRKRSFKKRSAAKSSLSGSAVSKKIEESMPLLPDYTIAIKADCTEDVTIGTNASSVRPSDEPNTLAELADPNGPFVLFEPPAAATYDNRNLAVQIVKFQCMDEVEDNGYEIEHENTETGYDNGNSMEDGAVLSSSSADGGVMLGKEDDSITVITLQNLDDHTHTTCVRMDVGQTVEPTLINELTPVEIKYDEYDPEDQLLMAGSLKQEQCNAVKANHQVMNPESSVPVNVQIINYPSSATVPAKEPLPYMVYEKMECGSSSSAIIIPEQVLPGKAMTFVEQPAQYASPVQEIRDEAKVGQQASSASVVLLNDATDGLLSGQSKEHIPMAMQNVPNCYTATVINVPKHEMVPNLPEQQHTESAVLGKEEPCKQDTSATVEGMEEHQQSEESIEEEDDGGFSLEDIDINSLVLVESQDSVNPNQTFYEIYVSDPDTGQLSEKPLDVPADVIESIRQILESGER